MAVKDAEFEFERLFKWFLVAPKDVIFFTDFFSSLKIQWKILLIPKWLQLIVTDGRWLHSLSLSLQFCFTEKPVPLQFEPGIICSGSWKAEAWPRLISVSWKWSQFKGPIPMVAIEQSGKIAFTKPQKWRLYQCLTCSFWQFHCASSLCDLNWFGWNDIWNKMDLMGVWKFDGEMSQVPIWHDKCIINPWCKPWNGEIQVEYHQLM